MAKRYTRNPEFFPEDLGDGVLLIDAESSKVIEFNSSGAVLWRELETPASASQLLDVLTAKYPKISKEALKHDIDSFLETASDYRAILETSP